MVATSPQSPPGDIVRKVPVGRRVFLGMAAVTAVGIAFGARIQRAISDVVGSGLGGILPGGSHFRIYSITGSLPVIAPEQYQLTVSGLVDRPTTLSFQDLKAMPSVRLTRDFHCVTGWVVPTVHWEGVRLSDILDVVGVSAGAAAITASTPTTERTPRASHSSRPVYRMSWWPTGCWVDR